jgi:hypothetical protein
MSEDRDFAFIGKGIDLSNVIHDWHGSVKSLETIAGYIFRNFSLDELVLLAPQTIDSEMLKYPHTKHPMCLSKFLTQEAQILAERDFFIWGLDSI